MARLTKSIGRCEVRQCEHAARWEQAVGLAHYQAAYSAGETPPFTVVRVCGEHKQVWSGHLAVLGEKPLVGQIDEQAVIDKALGRS